jgi:transcriptional regulator with XRE-family HTH domain
MLMISPESMRMARAALQMSLRDLGFEIGVSANALSRHERGDENVISAATVIRAQNFFNERKIYFGPANGVCIGQDVFAQSRLMRASLSIILHQHGIYPSSSELIAAYSACEELEKIDE